MNGIIIHIITWWLLTNRTVYLIYLEPSPNHILSKLGQWSSEKPLKISGRLVQASGREYTYLKTDKLEIMVRLLMNLYKLNHRTPLSTNC